MSKAVDTWGDEQVRTSNAAASSSGPASRNVSKTAKPIVVCDDWEAEEEEEETDPRSAEIQNKRIWEAANARESRPMPAVVMSRGSSVGTSMPTLPLNQPPAVRILKRPSASPSQSSVNANTSAAETLQDREARYQAARDRIFGASTSNENSTLTDGDKNIALPTIRPAPSPTSSANLVPTQRVIREPRGPGSSMNQLNESSSKGFGSRKGHRPMDSSEVSGSGTQALSEKGMA